MRGWSSGGRWRPRLVAVVVGVDERAGGVGAATVTIQNFEFHPGTLTVKAGARVTLQNMDTATHTATGVNGEFNTMSLAPGTSMTVTLGNPGTVQYRCNIHQT